MVGLGGFRLLVVGAGGIGCELLKTLIVTGFEHIEIIDLDTIEVSNLNRQFLFNKSHVGLSKAKVARDSILKMNPNACVIAHHNDVTSTKFDIDFFKLFDIVLNALDNRTARSHVNKMCILSNLPLIDGGTAGFLGQLHVIKKSITACYDCTPRSDNKRKSYPICTIRNTPSEMIHCVVWSKYLFEMLFALEHGTNDYYNTLTNITNDDHKDIEDDETFISTKIKELNNNTDSIDKFIGHILHKYFKEDIEKLLTMEQLWVTRQKPIPLNVDFFEINRKPNGEYIESLDSFITTSIYNYISVFVHSTNKLIQQWFTQKFIKWDKDDDLIIDFTTSAANIRANIFGIKPETKFEIKSMAGNIIPAIATTNAIIAGLMVAEALKIVEGNINKCHSVYISNNIRSSSKILQPCKPDLPNPNCPVCADKSYFVIILDINNISLHQFEQFLIERCSILKPDVFDQQSGRIIISSDDDDMCNIDKTQFLCSYGITNGSILTVEDFNSDLIIEIIIKHRDCTDSMSSSVIEIEDQHFVESIEKLSASKRSFSLSGIDETDLHISNKISKIHTSSDSDDLIIQDHSNDSDCRIIT